MSTSREPRSTVRRAIAAALGLAMAAASGVWLWQNTDTAPAPDIALLPGSSPAHGSTSPRANPVTDTAAGLSDLPGDRPDTARVSAATSAPLSAAALGMVRQIDRLSALPPGDDAITLGQQLVASATPANAPAFRDALLRTSSPAIERVAIAALARTADSAVMQDLARAYGDLPAEQRGRVLQVLEGAANPAALEGLTRIVEADTSEKRSPLTMSALYGLASLGTMDSVDYLLRQTTTDTIDHALMAMERVRTRQGVELIRAAAAGSSKDHAQLSPSLRGHLGRIARLAEAQTTP
ncbi:MAG: hypothetical protein KAX42_02365 [Sphaerotilus sp.]|nr:hypothetical protein [Sphaerotilus sp.]